ncbi:MAG: filamentation induced by cAMP protein Fic [Anaerocolumna sp.]|jgi:Fic family protein|nr:filamentation induced by cAMP protein Fic [Anaerocolumna sp.]
MEYITVSQAANKWNISDRRVRILCSEGMIEGVVKEGRSYKIPAYALKPMDGRILRGKEIDGKYKSLFRRIDSKKNELASRRPLTQGEMKRLQEEFLLDFTYNSNAIEGNTLTLQETAMVLEGITIDKKPLKDHLEAVGHKEAFEYVKQLVVDKMEFSEKIIKEIHSLVLMDRREDRGVYRRIPVRIMGAAHEPPKPIMVPELMESLIKEHMEMKKKLHVIELVSRFHMDFEGIHPFIDGNGRTGRLLLNFELMQNGYLPINVKFTDRRTYYECFAAYHQDGDADYIISLVADYIEEELDRYLGML